MDSSVVYFILGLIIVALSLVTGWLFASRYHAAKNIEPYSEPMSELFESTPDALLICDHRGKVVKVNQQAETLLGYTRDEFMGMPVEKLMPERYRQSHVNMRKHFFDNPVPRTMGQGRDMVALTKDGKEIHVDIALGHAEAPEGAKVIITLRDITARKEDEQTIYQLAYYDTLTGLPNRPHFNEHVKSVIERARDTKTRFAVFLLDMDDFKRVNDTLGHFAGDKLLQEIAVRLERVVSQQIDDNGYQRGFASRLGGDEFILIVENLLDARHAERVAEQIFEQFEDFIIIEEQEIYVKLTIGISLYPHDGTSPSSLLKAADLALYFAKDKGKNQFSFHETSMNTCMLERFQYENAIRYFIETGNFSLQYQPIFNIKDGGIEGAEALFRANPLKCGEVCIQRMIEVAEDTGMIVELGRVIFDQICRECADLIYEKDIIVSVNVSIRELIEPDFVDTFVETLEQYKISPKNIAIEVTESLFMENYTDNVRKLTQLKEMGVHLSIDDFGKGYSSMSYLRKFPANKLKVDKEFIDHIAGDCKSKEIVKGITSMAHTLGMVVCAEGVETDEQFKVLREIYVDQSQGYLTGRPTPIDMFAKMVEGV